MDKKIKKLGCGCEYEIYDGWESRIKTCDTHKTGIDIKNFKQEKINYLKNTIHNELAKTDYKIWKYQEGQLSNAEYKNIKGLRQKIRDKFTEAEAKILEAETIAEIEEIEKNFEL